MYSPKPRSPLGIAFRSLRIGAILGLASALVLGVLHTVEGRFGNVWDVLALHLWFALFYVPILCVAVGGSTLAIALVSQLVSKTGLDEKRERRVLVVVLWSLCAAFWLVNVLYKFPFSKAPLVDGYGTMRVFAGVLGLAIAALSVPVAWLAVRFVYPVMSFRWRTWGGVIAGYVVIVVLVGLVASAAYRTPVYGDAVVQMAVRSDAPKVVEIGFDGATWAVMDAMMGAGELPHFKRLIDEGVSGPLETLPGANSAINRMLSGSPRYVVKTWRLKSSPGGTSGRKSLNVSR